MRYSTFTTSILLLGAVLLSSAALAQEPKPGRLKVTVSPSEAYTFLDLRAMGPGDQSIEVAPGNHKVMVANYGFKFFQQDVDIQPGQTASVTAKLEPSGAPVSGPHGRIQFEVGLWKAGDYAVFLNGKTPGYFVGHVDEFNNDIGWKQELIVPPGNYDVTVTRHGKVAWMGKVPVSANQRTIVDISNGHQRTKEWPRGAELGAMNRFKAGTASAAVVVAPVSGSISVNPAKINCGQPAELKWASVETIDSEITHMSPVPREGQATVSPKQTTTYDLTATGPGGVVNSSTTLDVNPTVVAQLEASPAEVRYRRIGDKVIEQKDTTLNWSTSNAQSISVTPLGSVDASGTRSIPVVPTTSAEGSVDETFTYNLNASNVCGGSEAKAASVHLTGSIEPIPTVLLKSIYFPTDYPDKADPSLGLLQSQQDELGTLAAGFTKYLEYDPDAKLSITGYADERGPNSHNQPLSERRAQRVKEFLVSKGVAEEKMEVMAVGDTQQLDKQAVDQLQKDNPNPPPEAHVKNPQATWLAYNRRVDIILMPKNEASVRFYPNQAPDSTILWQKPKPDPKIVAQNQ
jgi:outer membrane protein OmpA-like peptidoglycan-associated protein